MAADELAMIQNIGSHSIYLVRLQHSGFSMKRLQLD